MYRGHNILDTFPPTLMIICVRVGHTRESPEVSFLPLFVRVSLWEEN